MRALLQKEMRDLVRTRRIIFLPAAFAVFGILAPSLIRLLPTVIKQAGQQVQIAMPDFGPADGLAQYLQFSRQLGLLVMIIIFMGIVAGERAGGLLSVLFVKPVSRLRYLSLRWVLNATLRGRLVRGRGRCSDPVHHPPAGETSCWSHGNRTSALRVLRGPCVLLDLLLLRTFQARPRGRRRVYRSPVRPPVLGNLVEATGDVGTVRCRELRVGSYRKRRCHARQPNGVRGRKRRDRSGSQPGPAPCCVRGAP